jgi:hypothetical protein
MGMKFSIAVKSNTQMFVRIVIGLPLFASRQSIYSEAGWELLSDRRRVRRLSLFYSIHNKSAPDYLCDLVKHNYYYFVNYTGKQYQLEGASNHKDSQGQICCE